MCFSQTKFPEVSTEKAPKLPQPAKTEQVALQDQELRKDQTLGARIGLSRLVVPIDRQIKV